MTGLKKSLVSETGGKMVLDFRERNEESCMAMQGFGTVQIGFLLSTQGSESGRCGADESHRRAIYEDAFLRKSEDGCVFKSPWPLGKSEADSEVDARDGDSWDVPRTQYQPASYESCGLSVPLKKSFDRASQSCLECRHHLYSAVERVCIFGGNHRLVFPICVVLSDLKQFGDGILSRGSRSGAGYRDSRYFQYGPRMSVYRRRFYGAVKKARDQNQHGWERKGLRQYICGATLEKCEVREYLSQRVSNNDRSEGGLKTLFSVLQQRAVSSIAWVQNPARDLRGENRMGKGIYWSTLIHKKERKKNQKNK